ncbi:hypothetical protein DPMN_151239 [Dreissena polymorpha]|uniref:Uncharacterized protein n=1 Tax=Dreissena polymorpha TaxID=45954 RepID=A0A9D4FJJ5_DREPO|nr:hypothetical protein DPMN_151239 [Dreissena polymorpha]
MIKSKLSHYESKFEELMKTLEKKMDIRLRDKSIPHPEVFFSYSWVNSQQAVTLGTRYSIVMYNLPSYLFFSYLWVNSQHAATLGIR